MSLAGFDLTGRVAVITGGYGVLGGSMADALADAGAKIVILGRRREEGTRKASQLEDRGVEALMVEADVLDTEQLRRARDEILNAWKSVDILVNAAGGNVARSRTDTVPVFEVPHDAFDEVLALNLHGTVNPTLVFGEAMSRQKRGVVINISSMAASRAMSGVPGYSIAKAGVENFTRWMAMEMARKYGDGIRVNAIAPGFFITAQNRSVLLNPDGTPTPRAKAVIAQTPMGRFGNSGELAGAVQWLASDAASFVTGAVIPVDGGFSIYSGV
ncbi:MAG TPA: SDR family oxidoreductase [Gemmatimonadaceae bacterium]|nr:SDR family oxidoreductase [Gemmatimonadaceae bacterium]